MPQHDRTGPLWTARRLRRRLQLERDLRRRPFRRDTEVGPSETTHGTTAASVATGADEPRTTVDATIGPGMGRFYRGLVWRAGEPHLLRCELGGAADPHRTASRRSMLYFAHHTDVHLCDVQSPSRLEVGERLAFLAPGTDAGHRPQEHATVQVFDQMIRATNRLTSSPFTGADMDFLVLTGDNTDNRQYCELRWFIDTLDGLTVTPNTGGPTYEGAQDSVDFPWVYHPEDPHDDVYGRFGFPRLPGLLASAIRPFETEGSAVPWLTVLGNHDMIWQGTFGIRGRLRLGDLGERLSLSADKPNRLWSLMAEAVAEHVRSPRAVELLERLGSRRSTSITADPLARRQLPLDEYLAEYFVTEPTPGPVGHGLTEQNLRDGTAYWSRTHGEDFLLIGLDTNNHTTGSEGRVGPRQLNWLNAQLEAASAAGRLVIVFSHHNSATMTNGVDDLDDPGRSTDGEQLVALLADRRNVVLWINGHDHENRIVAHPSPGRARGSNGSAAVGSVGTPRSAGGFWEVTTASCIDFGQQSRTIEVVDNGDGTLSVLVTVVDHAAPLSVAPRRDGVYSPEQMASLSREFASNDSRWIDPWDQRGDVADRNVELLVVDPRVR